MKGFTVFYISSAILAAVNAKSFSKEDQAILIDRHNYFRSTALPSAAGNMLRIGWSDVLASKADSKASTCSATTSKGVNVYQSSKKTSSIIEGAIQEWVIETAKSTIKMIPQPSVSGVDVGKGIYNPYSQVVWATTSSVGCATASCPDGEVIVCMYSPPGNDKNSAWYKHQSQGSGCPSGTVSSHGLCIVEGASVNDQIAPIPDGKWTYQVYPAFVAQIHSILINSARDIANEHLSLASQTLSEKTTDTESKYKSSLEFSSFVTQSKMEEDTVGTVSPYDDNGLALQHDAETTERHKEKTNSKEDVSTGAGHEEEETHGISINNVFGMYLLGILAVAGIIVYVHVTTSTEHQHNDIPAK
ncbi:unnamed protein product [Peronospora belbahrii]|uniref:SCP domain-containing protein n=1 Tax=Peronospora belbahrii TaxID=622444 RepID=A0AAU9KXK9_9STRA|nr:unnamed protein product [Peronospora belbahrii]